MLFSCDAKPVTVESITNETMMTEYSENLAITMSENGRRSYHFVAPLMEGYSAARDPYREFRRGVDITIYDENTGEQSARLTANYAIFYESRKLWEAKGDVVATNSDGRQLFTSQLFWNQTTHRVYSNVDSKLVDGDEVHHCEGFESDEAMKDWTYRKLKGVTYISDEVTEPKDSTAQASTVSVDGADEQLSAERQTSRTTQPNTKAKQGNDLHTLTPLKRNN